MAEPLCSLHHTDEPQKGQNSCLPLRLHSVFGSFSVVLMSCTVNFCIVRSALQNSVCLFFVYMYILEKAATQERWVSVYNTPF